MAEGQKVKAGKKLKWTFSFRPTLRVHWWRNSGPERWAGLRKSLSRMVVGLKLGPRTPCPQTSQCWLPTHSQQGKGREERGHPLFSEEGSEKDGGSWEGEGWWHSRQNSELWGLTPFNEAPQNDHGNILECLQGPLLAPSWFYLEWIMTLIFTSHQEIWVLIPSSA